MRPYYRRITLVLALVFTAAVESVVPQSRDKKLPNVLLVGVGKSGTTALLAMLALHPHVSSTAREQYFFSRDREYRKGMDAYRSRMAPHSADAAVVIEKVSKSSPIVTERIKAFNASVLLVMIVREPAERTLSTWSHLDDPKYFKFFAGLFPNRNLLSFDTIFGAHNWNETATTCQASQEGLEVTRDLLLGTSYSDRLRQWLRHFPRKQILILDGDLLARNPAGVLRQTWAWLGVDPDLVPSDRFYYNATKGFYCWHQETAGMKRQQEGQCMNSDKGRQHPVVSPDTLPRLRRYFQPHNKEFFKLTGLIFPTWSLRKHRNLR